MSIVVAYSPDRFGQAALDHAADIARRDRSRVVVVNATLGKIVRFVSIPLYIVTLGLVGLIVNGFLFAVVAWVSDLAGFGLRIETFWWGVLAALVMTVISSILNGLLGTSKKNDRRDR